MAKDLSVIQGTGVATPAGDWATVDGLAQRRQSLLRRLTTPLGALWYDPSYGNAAYQRISQPATAAWMQDIAAACRVAAQQEAGVTVSDVQVTRQDRVTTVRLVIVWDGQTPDVLQTQLGGG